LETVTPGEARGQGLLARKAFLPYSMDMSVLKITSKGQVTLNREVLSHLGARPGDRIEVEKLPGGRVEVRIQGPSRAIEDVFGLLKPDHAASLTLERMNEIIAEGWAGKA
jgi:bifunctional DNA-binding transcriptional regulator/antitoxin component of YhaV-PrlF toxin-antitoxin module